MRPPSNSPEGEGKSLTPSPSPKGEGSRMKEEIVKNENEKI